MFLEHVSMWLEWHLMSMVCKTWPSSNPHTNLIAVISVPANYLGQWLLRIYILNIMEFYNSSLELEMIHNFDNIQGNKMLYN